MLVLFYLYTSGFAASRMQSKAYMDCRSPIHASSALGNWSPMQNREYEREKEAERERGEREEKGRGEREREREI